MAVSPVEKQPAVAPNGEILPPTRWKVKSIGAAQSPLLGAAMFAPAVIYLLAIIGAPFVLAVVYAFSDVRIGSTGMHYVGLENFRSILQSPSFRTSVMNSFIFTFFSQVIVIVGSTILSVALEEKFRGRGFFRFLILLPWVAPISLGAIGWKWILDSLYSVINWVLVAVHLYKPYSAPMWLGEPHLAMASVILVHSWRLLPFSTVILLAGLTAIPREIPEAASIDGAGFWRTLFQINIPMMLPIINVAVLFGIIFTFTDMTVVYILTAGGPFDSTQVLPSYAYFTGILGSDLAAGAAVSLFLVPLLVVIAYFMLRTAHRAEVV
ncbi:MAG TPA: sugar ABC transporter permease [Candidatus Limnocylindrales bacterium]|nr:sugar ABC transporter permease [Candidatus Limnocylindrales bacterium]